MEKIRHCAFDQRSTEWLSAQCPRHLLYAKAGINQRDGAETRAYPMSFKPYAISVIIRTML